MRRMGLAIVVATIGGGPVSAGTLATIYTFTGGADGGVPFAGLLPGPNRSFFGTTTLGAGSVFQLTPPAPGASAWTLTTLYTFTNGADGDFPQTLVMDRSGALYGMADHGGLRTGVCVQGGVDIGCGTVFRLAPPAPGQSAWSFSVLWSFTGGADGSSPTGGVAIGGRGELYGFTYGGFTCGQGPCGGVYRLDPPAKGQTAWTETTLYAFSGGADGGLAGSYGAPVLGSDGTIYGEAGIGGKTTGPVCGGAGCGTVFALHPPGWSGGAWTLETLLAFDGTNGIQPIGGLSRDGAGNLYGGTNEGGRLQTCMPGGGFPNGCGVAFRLSPGGSGWSLSLLHRFSNAADGGYPFGPPARFGARIIATTSGDGVHSLGSLDQLTESGAARPVFTFTNDANGSGPVSTLTQRDGTIYGVTAGLGSGPAPYGTVFAYTP